MLKTAKIRSIIRLGIGLLILLILGQSIYAYNQVNNLASNKMVHASKSEEMIKTVLSIRKDEKDFLLRETTNEEFFETKQSKYLGKMSENEKLLNGVIDELIEFSQGDETAITEISEFRNQFELYMSEFLKLSDKISEKGFNNYGAVGELRENVHTIESTLEKLSDQENLIIIMLTLRRNEKDYMLRNDIKYQEKLHKNVDLFISELDNSDILVSTKRELNKEVLAYKSAFDKIVNIDNEIGRSSEEGIMKTYRNYAHNMNEHAVDISDEIFTSIEHDRKIVTRRIIIISIVILIAAMVLGLIISKVVLSSIKKTNNQLKVLATGEGDLTHRVYEGEKNEMGDLKNSIQLFIDKTRNIMTQVISGTNSVRSSSEELSSATEEANKNIEEISTRMSHIASEFEISSGAVEQTTASVNELSESADYVYEKATVITESSASALESVNNGAEKLSEVVNSVSTLESVSLNVVDSITKLDGYSKEIVNIVGMIKGFTEQTNLLALNASIEAARAGEHGRGFAVVAEEVRKLAEESSNSTEKISGLTEKIQQMVTLTKGEIENEARQIEISARNSHSAQLEFDNIEAKISENIELINEILNLAKEQAETTQTVSGAMEEISTSTEKNAFATAEISESIESQVSIFEEIGASLLELNGVANSLKDETQKFKV